MAKTHIVLHIAIDWEFGEAELVNLLDEAMIILPNGSIIYNNNENGDTIVCQSVAKEIE